MSVNIQCTKLGDENWAEFQSANDLLISTLSSILHAYQIGGVTKLRGLNKSKSNRLFNDQLKRVKSEYFPLALYIKKCFPDNKIKKICIPTNLSNPGFDARIYLENIPFYVEITTTVDGLADYRYFEAIAKGKQPNATECSSRLKIDHENEIKRIQDIILKKTNKDTYAEYRPILLVAFDVNNGMNFVYDHEFNVLKEQMNNFTTENSGKLAQIFSKIVLIKFRPTLSYVRRLYEEEIIALPTEDEMDIFIHELPI